MTIKEDLLKLIDTELNIQVVDGSPVPSMGDRGVWNHIVVPKIKTAIQSKSNAYLIEVKDIASKVLSDLNNVGISPDLNRLELFLSS